VQSHQAATCLAMAENELQRMVDALAEKLQRSVVINDPEIRLICASRHFGDEDQVRVHAVLQRITESAAIGHILSHGVARWSGPGVVPGRADIGMAARLCMPIRWQGVLHGLLMVIDPDASLTAAQIDAIKAASPDMAASLFRNSAAEDEEKTARETALRELLSAKSAKRQSGSHYAEKTGWPRGTTNVTVSVAEVVETSVDVETAHVEVALRAAMEHVTRERATASDGLLAKNRHAVLLQSWDQPPAEGQIRADAHRIAANVQNFLSHSCRCVIGVGAVKAGLSEAWVSHQQAVIAARAAQLLPHLKDVALWADLGVYELLLRIPTRHLTFSALPASLQALMACDAHGRLWETLASYLDHAGSSPATAAALHIHRTSLYYRLHQIQDITGLDLDNGNDRLVLHLGIRLAGLVDAPGLPTLRAEFRQNEE